jgi:hypothetical protein
MKKGTASQRFDHTVRSPDGEVMIPNLRAIEAILLKCAECMGWQLAEIDRCVDKLCPLWPWRGRTTLHKGRKEFDDPEKELRRESGKKLAAQRHVRPSASKVSGSYPELMPLQK